MMFGCCCRSRTVHSMDAIRKRTPILGRQELLRTLRVHEDIFHLLRSLSVANSTEKRELRSVYLLLHKFAEGNERNQHVLSPLLGLMLTHLGSQTGCSFLLKELLRNTSLVAGLSDVRQPPARCVEATFFFSFCAVVVAFVMHMC